MAFEEHKILEENRTIQGLADSPNQGNLTAQQLKAKFDEFPELLRQRLNALIDDLAAYYPDDEELRLTQARVQAYATHGGLLASPTHAGHVRVDNRTISLNEAGQLVAQGAAAPLASFEEALAGEDNSSVMTPLRVKQAIEQGKQGLNYALRDICALSGDFSVCAWHPQATLLALAMKDEATEEPYSLCIYSVTEGAATKIAALTPAADATTLLWNESGDMLAYSDGQGKAGWAFWDGLTLQTGSMPTGAVKELAFRPGGQLAVVWQASPATLSLYQRQGLNLTMSGTHALAGTQEIGPFAYAPGRSDKLALAARQGTVWRLLLLDHNTGGLTNSIAADIATAPAALSWRPAGGLLALGFASGTTILSLYAAPLIGGAWKQCCALSGDGLSGLSWQGEGQYLALSRQSAGPLYELFACDGATLLPVLRSLKPGQGGLPAFHGTGQFFAVLGGEALHVLEFTAQSAGRWLERANDFTAMSGGAYFLPPGVATMKIRCFAQPQPGQYFDFWGEFPGQAQLETNGYPLSDKGARGRGLYRVVFLAEEWSVLPLGAPLADSVEAEAAASDTVALTPYGGERLLAKRGRRAATIVVAAVDSLHKEAADFICTGQSDQLVIKQALAALPANGGKLALLEGTYTLDNMGVTATGGVFRLVDIDKPYVSVSGMGKATCIRLADNVAKTAGQQFSLLYANGPGFTLRDCLLDGMKGNGNNTGKVTGLNLSVYAEQSEVQNCVFRNCSEAGMMSSGLYAHIHHNWMQGNFNGLAIDGGESIVTANNIYQNTNCGVYAANSSDMLMNNHLVNNIKCAFELRGCNNSQIVMNTLIGNSSGVMIFNSTFIIIKDNYVRRALGSAVYSTAEKSFWVESSTDIMLVGNWLRGKEAESGSGCARLWASYGGTDWNPVI